MEYFCHFSEDVRCSIVSILSLEPTMGYNGLALPSILQLSGGSSQLKIRKLNHSKGAMCLFLSLPAVIFKGSTSLDHIMFSFRIIVSLDFFFVVTQDCNSESLKNKAP